MSDVFNPADWQFASITIAAIAFIQTSVVLLIALTAAKVFKGSGPAVRSAILRGALATIAGCWVVSIGFHYAGVPHLTLITRLARAAEVEMPTASGSPRAAWTATDARDSRTGVASEAQTLGEGIPRPGPFAPASPARASAPGFRAAFLSIWVLLSALLMGRLIVANVLITLIRRRSRRASAAVDASCARIAGQLQVRCPAVLVTPEVSGPCLVGWLRPAILLPSDEDVDSAILVHELAHLRRHDCPWHLGARIASALLWFQPLLWILSRDLERTAEEACDDAVLQWGGDRTSYAHGLVELAERAQRRWMTPGIGVGVVGIRSAVGRRVARLLSMASSAPPRLNWPMRGGLVLAAAVLTIGLAAIRPITAGSARAAAPQSAPATAREHGGRVLAADGKPVAGAYVDLVQYDPWEPIALESVRTESDGSFKLVKPLTDSDEKRLEIVAFAPGKGLGDSAFNAAGENEIRLEPATQITVKLIDPDGKPISGMRVSPSGFVPASISRGAGPPKRLFFLTLSPQSKARLAATSAADGSVTFHDLPRGTQFNLDFDDGRFAYLDARKRIRLSDNEPVSPPATVQLEAAATIAGTVRFGASGQSAAGIRVYAQGTNRSGSANSLAAVTGRNGDFKIQHLTAGEYNVMLRLDEQTQKDWAAAAHEGIKVQAGQTLNDVNFTLIKGGIVTGRVTMADSGKPFTQTEVAAQGPARPRSSASVQGVVTDAEGRYSLRVPPGVQYVYVMGVAPQAYRQERQDIREVRVEDGQTVTLDFKIPRRGGAAVTGMVIGLDGKPAGGIAVRAQTSEIEEFAYTRTDAQGRFHFDALAPGTPVSVQDGALGTAEPTSVQEGQGEIRLQLVRRVKLTLKGIVTDEQGKPIPHARIKLTESVGRYGHGDSQPRLSGADGTYEIGDLYTDNRYSIAAEADGFGEAQARLHLDANTRQLPTLKLPRADAVTGGIVVDPEGKPVAGIPVHLNNGLFPKTVPTDAQGRFSFPVVPGKNHLIWIAVKEQAKVGPNANGRAGRNDIKLVLPKEEQ